MEDKELLEMAAKAAGLDGSYYNDETGEGVYCNDENDCGYGWNPLTDDGDALRLAVNLRLHIEWRADGRSAVSPEDGYSGIYELASSRENALENLRRAIVRAAAEIGKQMNSDKR